MMIRSKSFEPGVMQQSSLFDLLVSYEENDVLWMRALVPYSQHLFSLLRWNGPNKLECYIKQDSKIVSYKHYSLLGPFESYEENKVLWKQALV